MRFWQYIWRRNSCLLCGWQIPALELEQCPYICADCRQALAAYRCCPRCAGFWPLGSAKGHHCTAPPADPLAGMIAFAPYAGLLRQKLLRLKYRGRPQLAKSLGQVMANAWRQTGWQAEVIVPVPLHTDRLRQRGYNQCQLLAEVCGGALGLPVADGALLRLRATQAQNRLGPQERQSNVQGAFACGPAAGELAGKRLLLLDDIITTGATLRACAVALQAVQPAAVYGLAVAGKLLEPSET